LKITSCRLEGTAYRTEDEPRAEGPLVVFLGRSNVGKSSLINRLLGASNLARTSSQPGKTQSVNFYQVNGSFHFVDLPGYGYAAAPEAVRRSWGPMVEGFLNRQRDRIVLAVLLVDARHGATELDRVMKGWLEAKGLPHVVAATKTDKLSGNERSATERSLRAWLEDPDGQDSAVLVSGRTGFGVQDLWKRLDRALAGSGAGIRGKRWNSAN
jgi:GTP-binding protein